MKTKDLIKALLDFPIDSEVHVAGYDGATGERNWDGGVETVRYEFPGQVFIEFNELFMGVYEDEKSEKPAGGRVSAEHLRPGDRFDAEPIFDYYEREGVSFDEIDRFYAEAELEVVAGIYPAGGGYVTIATESGESYTVDNDLKIEVTNA